ncbi:MAG: ABC transporter permease [Chloroflexota bacterium]
MIGDILTILWKEFKEILLQRGSWRSSWISILVMLGVFGVYLPYQSGATWIQQPLSLLVWLWVPLFLVTSVVADSFAGERERHTLETLLASRLSDRAILLGKILAGVLYGWGITIVMLVLSIITVNVAHGRGQLLIYPPEALVGIVGLVFLVALLIAAVGVLVSLRASSTRQAIQIINLAVMLLLFVPVLGVQALPREMLATIVRSAEGLNLQMAFLIGAGVLLLADALLLAWAIGRFKRARLVLD